MRKSKPSSNRTSDKEFLIANKTSDESKSDINTKHSTTNIPSKSTQTTTIGTTATGISRNKSNRQSSTGTGTIRPSTIMSLEDRDIVVIDNVDYKESTSTEGTIIVVEKPIPWQQQHPSTQQALPKAQEIDLADLLKTDWPAAAGDMAAVLNNQSTSETNHSASQPSILTERNRSKNPLSHLANARIKRNVGTNTTNRSANLINLDSDGSTSSNENHCKSITGERKI